jgi:CubicO group peptidase (beta-lactamase class C family)
MMDQLRVYVDELAVSGAFSGVALFAREREPVQTWVYGLASRAFGIPNRLDTRFNLGSMNKMVTSVAIAQLVEAGRLAFADPIAAYLPDYPRAEVAQEVTIHHLLTHTSGLGNYWNARFEAARDRTRSVSDYLALFAEDPLLFQPGGRAEYSNAGYIVLGALIERVSGTSYDDYVHEHIYQRAGMADTEASPIDRDVPNQATGYTHASPDGETVPGEWWNNLLLLPARGGPAGGGYSTATDLLRFAQALLSHQLLSPEMTATVLEAKVTLRTRAYSAYGYGFCVEQRGPMRIVGHTGGAPGINAQLDLYPDEGTIVAVLANQDPPAAGLVASRVRELIAPLS